MIKLFNGDCREQSKQIEDSSVDLILCDPPYGTINGLEINGYKGKDLSWDETIDPVELFEIGERILRQNGKMILFSQEPYTSRLITTKARNIEFNYRMVWNKKHFANGLLAKVAPVSYYEDILVFSKKHDTSMAHPLRPYFSKILEFIGQSSGFIGDRLGHRKAEHCFYVGSTQFSPCTLDVYQELIDRFGIDSMDGFMVYPEIARLNIKPTSTFNLWQQQQSKSNIFDYARDTPSLHPTMKPVLLLEDLIKTYSNAGETVVDLTMGSGSTGEACHNTGRKFIGIEQDETYFEIAKKRIENHQKQLRMF
jgi:site-specific DNA-methyltransferase (adenine-specific)